MGCITLSVYCVLLISALKCQISILSNSLIFHSSIHAALLFLTFLTTESISSCVNCPSLVFNCLRIILVIGSCVTFGGFPSKFSKYCFHNCIHSSWLVAFSLAFALVFLLLTLFTVCHAILDCLSSTESLILLIWFCMYYVCSFRYTLTNLFCAFLRFRALVLVGFLLLHLEAVFTFARFFLTANVSYGTQDLGRCLVGMHSAAASKWALMKFSYSSLGVCVSDFSCSASNLFLSVNVCLSLISLFLSRDQSLCTVVVVRAAFLHRLSRIFGVKILWVICLAIQCTTIPFLIYKDVVYMCLSIICVGVGP